ncbi:MAG: energy transducer TonB [Opitutales bacterium]
MRSVNPFRTLLLLALFAPLCDAAENLSCTFPRLDRYLLPVLPEGEASLTEAKPPALDAFFDEQGTISGISRPNVGERNLAALAATLQFMRFTPALCFDEAVPGYARVKFPIYFVLQSAQDTEESESPVTPPFCRLALDGRMRALFGEISVYHGSDYTVEMSINAQGEVTKIRSRHDGVDDFLKGFFIREEGHAAFVPARRGETAVDSEVTLHWAPNLWEGTPRPEQSTPDASRPLPPWPEELTLEGESVAHMTIFAGPEGVVEGAFVHPDMPAELHRPFLAATRTWRMPTGDRVRPLELKIALLPERREIVELEVRETVATLPKAKKQARPTYPRRFFSEGRQGIVELVFAINSEGRVVPDSIEIARADHRLFGESAVNAVKKWRFTPATYEGEPVTVRVRQRIPFTLAR